MLRRIGIIAVLSLLGLALAAVPAIAAAPDTGSAHFIKSATSADVDTAGNLDVTFKETGLSAGSIETLTLSAFATADYQCFNNGGKHPKAANKETVADDVTASVNLPVGKNGNLVGTISVAPPGPGSFTCPSGQTLVGPTNVTYTDIVLTDETSLATISLGSAS
jgi:hypothetical protein